MIINASAGTDELETYRRWVSMEWASEHSFDPPDDSPPLPSPLLALSDGTLIGGISFTWHPAPATSQRALWINTLYIEPGSRGKGYALELIAAAEQRAKEAAGVGELYVYTNAPGLYEKRSWSLISKDKEMSVLNRKLE